MSPLILIQTCELKLDAHIQIRKLQEKKEEEEEEKVWWYSLVRESQSIGECDIKGGLGLSP